MFLWNQADHTIGRILEELLPISEAGQCAGMWRGLPVAIKTVLFQGGGRSAKAKRIIAETAIACALSNSSVFCITVSIIMMTQVHDPASHNSWGRQLALPLMDSQAALLNR